MDRLPRIIDLPNIPAVYMLFGGKKGNKFVAYVGIADKLRRRVSEHLIRRDSSITTATSIVSLNPDYITEIQWWSYPNFTERGFLEAAEEIAFEIFNPVLRSRGKLTSRAQDLLNNTEFRNEMQILFNSPPNGKLEFLDFQDVVDRIFQIEKNIALLSKKVDELNNN